MPDISSASFMNQALLSPTGQGAFQAATATADGATSGTGRLGKQDFLKLLMAQLQNQDPLKPMEDTQMIAQMAQFSALEATQHLSQVIEQSTNLQTVSQAGALVGKYVQAQQADGTTVTGSVTGVTFEATDGIVAPKLTVNGKDIDYSDIRKLSTSPITQ